jgi:hypothetical protein
VVPEAIAGIAQIPGVSDRMRVVNTLHTLAATLPRASLQIAAAKTPLLPARVGAWRAMMMLCNALIKRQQRAKNPSGMGAPGSEDPRSRSEAPQVEAPSGRGTLRPAPPA